jgi:RNA polymerase sigma-70 factor (ECF subfamily)
VIHDMTVASFEAEPSRSGDAEDVLGLFQLHGPGILRFCRLVLGNASDAEDVVQSTFLKLLGHLQAGGGRSNLKSWLFTVAANDCRTRMRGRFRWISWTADADSRIAPAEEDRPEASGALRALRTLRPRDRLLLSLRAQGLTYRQIAAAAGIREQSVGRLLARAVDRWKQRMTSEGESHALSD